MPGTRRQRRAPAPGAGGEAGLPPATPRGAACLERGSPAPRDLRRGGGGCWRGDAGGMRWPRRGRRGGPPGGGDGCPAAARVCHPPHPAPGLGKRTGSPGAEPPPPSPAWAPAERSPRGRRMPDPPDPLPPPRYLLLGQAGVGGAALPVGGEAHGASGQAPRPAGGGRVRGGRC